MYKSPDCPIRKFNPGTFQSDEEVIKQFVVRQREYDSVLEVLRGNINSPSCQHVLVVSPRGRGKTMLLARIAAELRTDNELSEHLFPVRFMEENQEISNQADFWLETLFQLAREISVQDPELGLELRKTYNDLVNRWREQSLDERARAAVLEAADRLDRKLVVMVENLQSLCENVDKDFGWKLRGILQSEPQIMLLASATNRFKGLEDARQPFFELFRIIDLEPLTTEECACLWQVVSGDTVNGREIRPLQILTGGNPRLLSIVAGFARHRSVRQLMEELVTLIDEHTEYFRAHLEILGKVERRVYIAVIDLWQASKPGEIADRARMDVRVVSTMLGRLVNRGAILVEGSGRKRLYSPAERLYSIYYKLRRERDEADIVKNLIHFMTVFYGKAEQVEIFLKMKQEIIESPTIHEGFNRAKASGIADQPTVLLGVGLESSMASALIKKANTYEQQNNFEAAIAAYDEVVKRFGASDTSDIQKWVAFALVNKAGMRRMLGDLVTAIATYDKVVERFGASDAPDIQWCIAAALVNKGNTLERLGDLETAIATYSDVVEYFGACDAPKMQWWIASALHNKSINQILVGRADEALHSCEELERRLGILSKGNEEIEFELKARCVRLKALFVLGNSQAAMDTFRLVYAAFVPNNEEMMHEMFQVVSDLIASGARVDELVEILCSDRTKSDTLAPLIIALRQYTGAPVRAPVEMLEVAEDIRNRINKKAVSE